MTYYIVVPLEQSDRACEILRDIPLRVAMGVIGSKADKPFLTVDSVEPFEDNAVIMYGAETQSAFALYDSPQLHLSEGGIAFNSVKLMGSNNFAVFSKTGCRFDHRGALINYQQAAIDPVYRSVVQQQLNVTGALTNEKTAKITAICMWDGWFNQPAYGRVYRTLKMIGAI